MQPTRVSESGDAESLEGTPYRFIRVLGRGGMSSVIEAEHVGLAQRVVVKLLRPELSSRNDLIERLRLEAQALARLAHPNLVRVTDFARSPSGRAYLVMERLHGKSVAHELRERGFVPWHEAIDWMRQTLAGLHAAHLAGLVHRDVKPENLFVCDGSPRIVKVLDFGIAKLVADAPLSGVEPLAVTREGVAIGTPYFTAPEQIQSGLVTPATDVYAAGLVLWELLVGRHAFEGRNTTDAIYHAQLLEMPPAPSRVAKQSLPAGLDSIVLRAVQKSPADRFASAEDFANALLSTTGQLPIAMHAADSRQAPTLASDSPTLESEIGRAPSVEVVLAPSVVDPGTVRLTPIAPTPPPAEVDAPTVRFSSSARERPKTESLGVLAIVLGIVACFSQIVALLYALREIVDPLGHVAELHGTPPPEARDDVELLARLAGGLGLIKTAAIVVLSFALIVVGVALVRHVEKSPRWARVWSAWALVAVGVGVLIDGATLLMRASIVSQVPTDHGIAASVGWAVGIAMLIGVTAVEVLMILVIRMWAGRLAR